MNMQSLTLPKKKKVLATIVEECEKEMKQNEQTEQKITEIQVTKEILDAYMEKHPYIYQKKPDEYAYMTDQEWLETDKWADRAAKMMVLSRQK